MCYMATLTKLRKAPTLRAAARTVGVRELRQNLSVYLERVKAGEVLAVTDHGEQVAILRPMPREDSPLRRLVAEGWATAPTRPVRDIKVPTSKADRLTIDVLNELGEDRF